MEIVSVNKVDSATSQPDSTQESNPETFELLAFDKGGYIHIQTNHRKYFYADSFFYAARDLLLVLKGDTKNLEYGIKESRITDPDAVTDRYLCITPEHLEEALTADVITSNYHTNVVKFFTMLLEMKKL